MHQRLVDGLQRVCKEYSPDRIPDATDAAALLKRYGTITSEQYETVANRDSKAGRRIVR